MPDHRLLSGVVSAFIALGLTSPVMADESSTASVAGSSELDSSRIDGEHISVVIDFASILKLERPARTIIIGNPGIVDATINGDRMIVLTGKTEGRTNVIVLDEAQNEVSNMTVEVVPGRRLKRVYHGTKRQTYACPSACVPVLSVGDDPQHFDSTKSQIQGRQDFANGRADQ